MSEPKGYIYSPGDGDVPSIRPHEREDRLHDLLLTAMEIMSNTRAFDPVMQGEWEAARNRWRDEWIPLLHEHQRDRLT